MNTNTYSVSWMERHRVTALVEASSPEEAIERVVNDEDEFILDELDIDAYGDIIPDTFEVELADDEDDDGID